MQLASTVPNAAMIQVFTIQPIIGNFTQSWVSRMLDELYVPTGWLVSDSIRCHLPFHFRKRRMIRECRWLCCSVTDTIGLAERTEIPYLEFPDFSNLIIQILILLGSNNEHQMFAETGEENIFCSEGIVISLFNADGWTIDVDTSDRMRFPSGSRLFIPV